jgi:hypothetical protein
MFEKKSTQINNNIEEDRFTTKRILHQNEIKSFTLQITAPLLPKSQTNHRQNLTNIQVLVSG